MSPNYPRPYGHNAECRWTIRVSEGSRISLAVVDIDIEEQAVCTYDVLEVCQEEHVFLREVEGLDNFGSHYPQKKL